MNATKAGILTPTTKAELERAERERDRLQGQLKAKATNGDKLAVLLPNLKERSAMVLTNLATTMKHQHMDEARETLLGREIVLHPSADGVERFLTAELSGDYAGVVRLVMVNNRGGGHGS